MDKKDLEEIGLVIENSNKKLKEELRKEIKDSNEKLRKELLDKMFVFEKEYGEKIDMIYEISVIQKDKAYQVQKENQELNEKVEELDQKVYSLDHRVFKLEHSSK